MWGQPYRLVAVLLGSKVRPAALQALRKDQSVTDAQFYGWSVVIFLALVSFLSVLISAVLDWLAKRAIAKQKDAYRSNKTPRSRV